MFATKSRAAALLVAVGVAASLLATGMAQAEGECAPASHAGGDWPSYGQNLSNTRAQAAETVIGADNAPLLAGEWAFSPADQGGIGAIQSTPVIAEGCVYITTAAGFIYALNADTGDLVWGKRLAETVRGVCCGGTLFSPTVADGDLYAFVSSNPATAAGERGVHVVKMDAHTGAIEWATDDLATEEGSYTNTSAVLYDGMLFVGISNPEMGYHEIGGFVLVDAETGDLIKRTLTIPDDQRTNGFAGGAIWSTAAVDTETGYAYVGTGQPSDWTGKESEFTNAIIKIDLARARDAAGNRIASSETTNPRFGEIVDTRKGTPDDPPYIDVDLAGSPTLYTDANGQKMVAAFQKSGWLHAAYTRTMADAWSTPLAPAGGPFGNYSSTATDGENIFGVGTFPGQMWSIDGTTGLPNWVMPMGNPMGANPVAYANGVVYHADGKGFLDAYDAATGLPLVQRPMALDAGGACTNVGGGVAIARNTVYAVCGDGGVQAPGYANNNSASGYLIAYRIPA